MKKSYQEKQRAKLEKDFGSYEERKIRYKDEYKNCSTSELKKERVFLKMEMEISASNNTSKLINNGIGILGLFLTLNNLLPDSPQKNIQNLSIMGFFIIVMFLIAFGEKSSRQDIVINMAYQMRIDCINELLDRRKVR